MDTDQFVGRRLALLLMGENEKGEEDWVVYAGIVQQEGERFFVEHDGGTVELHDDWLERIQSPDPETRSILLDAEYVLSLTVGNLPDGDDTSQLRKAGLKWPPQEEA